MSELTIQEFAQRLNGREYLVEITPEEKQDLRALGFVAVFGGSDDIMYLAGAINDSVDCYDGGFAFLDQGGLLTNECDDSDCPYYAKLKESTKTIEAVWDAEGYSWTYKTDIPHATFEIMEGEEKYCRGIVFDIRSLKD